MGTVKMKGYKKWEDKKMKGQEKWVEERCILSFQW